jgi:hypothetical protein
MLKKMETGLEVIKIECYKVINGVTLVIKNKINVVTLVINYMLWFKLSVLLIFSVEVTYNLILQKIIIITCNFFMKKITFSLTASVK